MQAFTGEVLQAPARLTVLECPKQRTDLVPTTSPVYVLIKWNSRCPHVRSVRTATTSSGGGVSGRRVRTDSSTRDCERE